jgi:hypothetical protein
MTADKAAAAAREEQIRKMAALIPNDAQRQRHAELRAALIQSREAIAGENKTYHERTVAMREASGLPLQRLPDEDRPSPADRPQCRKTVYVDSGTLEIVWTPDRPDPTDESIQTARQAAEKAIAAALDVPGPAAWYAHAVEERRLLAVEIEQARAGLKAAADAASDPKVAADRDVWQRHYAEAERLRVLLPSLVGRLNLLDLEITKAEPAALKCLEDAAVAAVDAHDKRPDNSAVFDRVVKAVEEVGQDFAPVPRMLLTRVKPAKIAAAALAKLRPPVAKPAEDSTPRPVEIPQPEAILNDPFATRPAGVDTITFHQRVRGPGVTIEKPDPDSPRTLRPDTPAGKPSQLPEDNPGQR